MSIYRKKSRHPKAILNVYRMFLMGISDEDIASAGVNVSEIEKCKKFHESLKEGKSSYIAGKALGIEKYISKRMLKMFEEWKAGKSISCEYSWRKEHPRITLCFSLLINGTSDRVLNEKFTDNEIEKAKMFLSYVTADKLTSSIAIETGLPKSTVKTLLKIYKTNVFMQACLQENR